MTASPGRTRPLSESRERATYERGGRIGGPRRFPDHRPAHQYRFTTDIPTVNRGLVTSPSAPRNVRSAE